MVANSPAAADPQLTAEQSAQHLSDLENELLNTLGTHLMNGFSKQHHLLEKQLEILQQIGGDLSSLLEQVKKISQAFATETDSVVQRFLASGASGASGASVNLESDADAEAEADASPPVASRRHSRPSRKRSRLDDPDAN